MDPIRAGDVLAAEAVALVYEPLLEVDYKVRPYRLKECVCELPEVSADGLVYTSSGGLRGMRCSPTP